MAGELVGNEGAQRRVALRAEAKVIHREMMPIAPDNGLGSFRQGGGGDADGVIVAADEIEFREARKARHGCRQVGREQIGIAESDVIHGLSLPA